MNDIKEFFKVINVRPRGNNMGGLRVRFKLIKRRTIKFLFWTKETEWSQEVETTNWNDHTRDFHFNVWESDARGNMSYDNGYCYMVTRSMTKHTFMSINRDQGRRLVDEWFILNNIDGGGPWLG